MKAHQSRSLPLRLPSLFPLSLSLPALLALLLCHFPNAHCVQVADIKCPVCRESMTRLISSYQPYDSTSIMLVDLHSLNYVKSVCDWKNKTGEWIKSYGIVQTGSSYALAPKSQETCGTDCELIAMACKSIVDKYYPDILELINVIEVKEQLIPIICSEVSKAC